MPSRRPSPESLRQFVQKLASADIHRFGMRATRSIAAILEYDPIDRALEAHGIDRLLPVARFCPGAVSTRKTGRSACHAPSSKLTSKRARLGMGPDNCTDRAAVVSVSSRSILVLFKDQ